MERGGEGCLIWKPGVFSLLYSTQQHTQATHAATSDAHKRSNTRSNERRAHTRVVVYVPALSLFSNVQRHPPEREGGGLGCDVVGVAVKSPGYEEEGDSSDEGTEHSTGSCCRATGCIARDARIGIEMTCVGVVAYACRLKENAVREKES